jgi:hypothetical protein
VAVIVPIISEFDSKGFDKAIKEFQSLEGVGAKSAFALKKAALPAAAAVGALGVALFDATKGAMEDAAAQDQLALALENTTGASKDQIKQTEDFISKMSLASGIADDQLRPAMANLARGTKDVAAAQDLLGLAMDISVGSGKDLATVSDALAKAQQGNYKALSSLSPEMKALVKEGADLNTIMGVLGGTFGGAAATQAATAQGQFQRFGIAVAEAKESIGAALIPVIEKFLPYLTQLGGWLQDNTTLFLVIAGAIGGLAGTILVLNAAMKAWSAIQTIVNGLTLVWNVLLNANPLGLIILAVVAFIAILTALYFKFEGVRNIVDTVFRFIKTAVTTGIDFLTKYVETVLSIYKTVFNTIAKLWNNTIGKLSFEIPSWVPGIGGKGFDVPDIPMLAAGGIVTGPTLAMIGEAGPEAVIPLNRAGGVGATYHITVNGGISNSADIGRAVVDAIKSFNRQNGPALIQVA